MNTIPALLKTLSGETVTTAEQWETFRRPEIMALFSNFVYGVRPVERPADLQFAVVKEQPDFDGQPITYRQIRQPSGCPAGWQEKPSPCTAVKVSFCRKKTRSRSTRPIMKAILVTM